MENFEDYIETYTYYDGPLSFTFTKTNDTTIYYGHLIDVNAEGQDIFLVIAVSGERLKQAKNGSIDLRTFLTEPENGRFDIVFSHGEKSRTNLTFDQLMTTISIDDFPQAGSTLL